MDQTIWLELARDKHARGALFFSGGDVYGQLPPEAGTVRETAFGPMGPMALRSCYSGSKRMGGTMCAAIEAILLVGMGAGARRRCAR